MTVKKRGWIKPAILTLALATAGGLGVAAAKSDDWRHGSCLRHSGYMHGGHGWFSSGRHTEGKLAFLKTELKITTEQEQAWNAFADAVREADQARADMWESHRERGRDHREPQDPPSLTERIDYQLEHMEQRMAMFKGLATAAKTLYSELTPEQQEVADELWPPRRSRYMRF